MAWGKKAPRPLPSAERLWEKFTYDERTGMLLRKKPWRGRTVACTPHSQGYLQVTVDGRQALSHRVIWKMVYGTEPNEIDHRDTDRANNRILNLRADDGLGNRKNKGLTKQNTSGLKGASLHRPSGLWRATIRCNGNWEQIGIFDTAEEAHAAYCVRAAELHGDFANTGRARD